MMKDDEVILGRGIMRGIGMCVGATPGLEVRQVLRTLLYIY